MTNMTKMVNNGFMLPAEWAEQAMIEIAWPHENTDWAYMLEDVDRCYVELAREISKRQKLLIVTPERERVSRLLSCEGVDCSSIFFLDTPTNDTWTRDYGFLSLVNDKGGKKVADFVFNGWGGKFDASLDNSVNAVMYEQFPEVGDMVSYDFVLEGGSVESDGRGSLLTTECCLMAPHRNQPMSRDEIELFLSQKLGTPNVLWLEHGFLEGDDTDGHVDTLARMCPGNVIAYVKCTDETDALYEGLRLMEEDLKAMRNIDGEPFILKALPMAEAVYDENDERLPATYANFLIMNDAVLYPTYAHVGNDRRAAAVLAEIFPGMEIVGVDCRALIRQHGSLHCATMQFPL